MDGEQFGFLCNNVFNFIAAAWNCFGSTVKKKNEELRAKVKTKHSWLHSESSELEQSSCLIYLFLKIFFVK